MASPVKVSDRLLALARQEAQGTHRSATAQIEHWATLGRAVEVMLAYRDVLALKRSGVTLPVPAHVSREDVQNLLVAIGADTSRDVVKRRIHASGGPVYGTDPAYPGTIVEVRADGTRTPGQLEGRTFVPHAGRRPGKTAPATLGRRAARVRRPRRASAPRRDAAP